MNYNTHIRNAIETQLTAGKRDFILFPFGEWGMLTKRILNEVYGIQEVCLIDNHLARFNPNIKELSCLREEAYKSCTILITSDNEDIYEELRNSVRAYADKSRIADIFERQFDRTRFMRPKHITKRGKYSYGPLCDHWLVESVGAFCGFAPGSDVVENHAMGYISTHPFLYYGTSDAHPMIYDGYKGEPGYLENVRPKGHADKLRRVKVGSDVWLGKNVIITNGANIGNGVIAGAGAVITKDVPDYAVVAGVPARIIRYRYTREQIEALNEIRWWDWPDERIREYYDDFYGDVNVFIRKHH